MHVKKQQHGIRCQYHHKSKRGILTSEDDSNYLQLELYDGIIMKIYIPKITMNANLPFAKSSFKKICNQY